MSAITALAVLAGILGGVVLILITVSNKVIREIMDNSDE